MNIYVTKNSLNNFYQRVARKNIFAYCHIASLSSSTPSSPTACSRTHSQTFGVFDVSECEKSSLSFIMSCDVGISDFHDIFATLMRSSHAIELSLIQLPASQPARPPITIRCVPSTVHINRCRFCCVCCQITLCMIAKSFSIYLFFAYCIGRQ